MGIFKKDLAFVLASTSNMAFATANVIKSICDNCTLKFDVIVFEEDFLTKDKELINNIHKTEFRKFDYPKNWNMLQMVIKQYSKFACARYECFKMLKDYKKVFWIDIDTIIMKNIDDIIKNFDKEIALTMTTDTVGSNFTRNLENYDMNKFSCNSGVLMISDKIKNVDKIHKYLYDMTAKYDDILYCPDQGILCLMLQDFNLDLQEMSELFNCHPTSKNAKNAYILHSYRSEKFWNFFSNKQWKKNYKLWIELGGSPYTGKHANLWQKFWKTYFYEIPDPLRYPKGFIKTVFK